MNEERRIEPSEPSESRCAEVSDAEAAEALISILESMPPLAVVGYYRHLSDIEAALMARQYKREPSTSNENRMLEEARVAGNNISLALELLPSRNIEHARRVIEAMVLSPLNDDRRVAAYFINKLTRYDHDYGMVLWAQLLRDSDAIVRMSAEESLPDLDLDDYPEELARVLSGIGLSRSDVSQLRLIYLDHEESGELNR